jgi:hypothetical protein
MLSGGVHQAGAAVWYNAESDWCGTDTVSLDDVSTTLLRSQIDFDLLPTDALRHAAVTDGKLVVNQESYRALVIPWAAWLPETVRAIFQRLSDAGLKVIECRDPSTLPATLRERGCAEIVLSQAEPDLMYHHILRGEQDVWMFHNQNPLRAIDVWLAADSPRCLYDAWENRLTSPQVAEGSIRLKLPPSGSIFVLGGDNPGQPPAHDYADEPLELVELDWSVALREAKKAEFTPYRQHAGLGNLAQELPEFCGTIRYEASLRANRASTRMDLGAVGETAELWVDGGYCGARISPPYCFECAVRPGENRIVVEVVNNPAYRERDDFSRMLPLPPTGLVGPIGLR